MLNEALPIVGKLINRYQNEAVIDIGKHDSDFKGLKIAVIRKDRLVIEKEGLGMVFDPSDLLGYFEPSKSEENLSEGILKRNGYYDRMKIIRIPIKKILCCFYFLGEFASKNSPAKNLI